MRDLKLVSCGGYTRLNNSNMTAKCLQGGVLMRMSLNMRSSSQQRALNGINGKNGCTLFYTWGLHCWWGHFCHPTMLGKDEELLHFTSLFTLALHTAVHQHGWRYHFWNRTGGSLMTLGMGIKYFNSSGYKKSREKDQEHVSKTLLGTCCLLYLEQSSWLLGWKAPAPFPSFSARREFHLPPVFFFSKDICHWTFYKSFRAKDSCKTGEAEVARGKKNPTHFRPENKGPF